MKHITFADKNLFTGDEAADLLLEYGAALANASRADTVSLTCIGTDGNEAEARFLLSASSPLMIESTSNHLPDPDNTRAVQYMRDRIESLGRNPQGGTPHDWDPDEIHDGAEF